MTSTTRTKPRTLPNPSPTTHPILSPMNALTGNPLRRAPGWVGPRGANGRLHETDLALPAVGGLKIGLRLPVGVSPVAAASERLRAIGYVRVSTDEQAGSGAGLVAQRDAIEAEAARRGWELLDIVEDAGLLGT